MPEVISMALYLTPQANTGHEGKVTKLTLRVDGNAVNSVEWKHFQSPWAWAGSPFLHVHNRGQRVTYSATQMTSGMMTFYLARGWLGWFAADMYPEGLGLTPALSGIHLEIFHLLQFRYWTLVYRVFKDLNESYTFPKGFTTSNQTRAEVQTLLQVTSFHRSLGWGHTETLVMAWWGAAGSWRADQTAWFSSIESYELYNLILSGSISRLQRVQTAECNELNRQAS